MANGGKPSNREPGKPFHRDPVTQPSYRQLYLPILELTLTMRSSDLVFDADIALGRLSGIVDVLPNPDLFVAMYVRKVSVLSLQIEGIQCTLDEVLEAEIDDGTIQTKTILEVINYVNAMNYGIALIARQPTHRPGFHPARARHNSADRA